MTRPDGRSVSRPSRSVATNLTDRFKLRLVHGKHNSIVGAECRKLKKGVIDNGMLLSKPVRCTNPLPNRPKKVAKKKRVWKNKKSARLFQ